MPFCLEDRLKPERPWQPREFRDVPCRSFFFHSFYFPVQLVQHDATWGNVIATAICGTTKASVTIDVFILKREITGKLSLLRFKSAWTFIYCILHESSFSFFFFSFSSPLYPRTLFYTIGCNICRLLTNRRFIQWCAFILITDYAHLYMTNLSQFQVKRNSFFFLLKLKVHYNSTRMTTWLSFEKTWQFIHFNIGNMEQVEIIRYKWQWMKIVTEFFVIL